MIVKLLNQQQLGFLSLKGGCTGSYESTLVKMPHCWKSHVTTQLSPLNGNIFPISKYNYMDGIVILIGKFFMYFKHHAQQSSDTENLNFCLSLHSTSILCVYEK